jgi:hypothetical protein
VLERLLELPVRHKLQMFTISQFTSLDQSGLNSFRLSLPAAEFTNLPGVIWAGRVCYDKADCRRIM